MNSNSRLPIEIESNYTSIEFSAISRSRSVVSLFSGAGGLDLGLESAGFETKACVEMDPNCRATLMQNRPGWILIDGKDKSRPGDIRSVDGEQILAALGTGRGNIDVVAGGPPCQSFSNLGLKRGRHDPVNGDLYQEYVRVVQQLLPKAIIFENVEGFNHAKHTDVRDYLFKELGEMGYKLASGVLNAASFGDPQIRKRFVVIGVREFRPLLPAPTHFESEQKYRSFFDSEALVVPPFRKFNTVQTALDELSSWDLRGRSDLLTMGVSNTVLARMKLISQGENFKVLPEDMRPTCWKTGKHQGNDTFGRLCSNRPSVTIRTSAYNPAKGRYIHPFEHRGLSTLEMAVLQSFPEGWKFKCSGRQTLVGIGKMIGNAVPLNLSRALGLAVMNILDSSEDLVENIPCVL